MDESQIHYMQRKKSDSKATYVGLHLHGFLENAKLEGLKSDWRLPGLGLGTGYRQTPGNFFGVMDMFDILMVVVIISLYVFVETCRTVC